MDDDPRWARMGSMVIDYDGWSISQGLVSQGVVDDPICQIKVYDPRWARNGGQL